MLPAGRRDARHHAGRATRLRPDESLAAFAAFLAAARGAAARLLVVVLDLAFDDGIGSEPGGRFAAAFADRLVAHELAARFALTPFARTAADLALVGQPVARDALGDLV